MRTTSRIRSARARSTPPAGERLVAAGALADRAQQRLGLFAEEREQEQLLLARGEPVRLRAQLVEVDGARRAASPANSSTARASAGSTGPGVGPKRPSTRSRSSSTIVE